MLRKNELLLVLEVKLLHCNVSRPQKTFYTVSPELCVTLELLV